MCVYRGSINTQSSEPSNEGLDAIRICGSSLLAILRKVFAGEEGRKLSLWCLWWLTTNDGQARNWAQAPDSIERRDAFEVIERAAREGLKLGARRCGGGPGSKVYFVFLRFDFKAPRSSFEETLWTRSVSLIWFRRWSSALTFDFNFVSINLLMLFLFSCLDLKLMISLQFVKFLEK